jgi:hypothetical protein
VSNATIQILDGHVGQDELYSLAEIRRRLGLGAHALRTARRHGLRVLRIGRNDFVLGKDLIQYAVATYSEPAQVNDVPDDEDDD